MSQIHPASPLYLAGLPVPQSGRAVNVATLSTSELFRGVNDKINLLGFAFLDLVDFVCECPDESCTRVMPMTREEYDAVRSQPGSFAMIPEHDLSVHRGGADQGLRFVIVEVDGTDGAASREATA
jgi:hypothetical protein